jgi:hypothetical protein
LRKKYEQPEHNHWRRCRHHRHSNRCDFYGESSCDACYVKHHFNNHNHRASGSGNTRPGYTGTNARAGYSSPSRSHDVDHDYNAGRASDDYTGDARHANIPASDHYAGTRDTGSREPSHNNASSTSNSLIS